MQIRRLIHFGTQALATLGLAVVLTGCGGGDDNGPELAPELYGTWDLVDIEAGTVVRACPGEIVISTTESVSCGTTAVSLNADGTYISIDTTDEFGNVFNERTEGTWSTSGNELTITETRQGPDASSLVPINPAEVTTVTWSVSGNVLTLTMSDPGLPLSVTSRLRKR